MLHHQMFRDPEPGQPRLLAAFAYRYDAHLVPDLIENIRPGIHGVVAWDDRSAEAALSDEPSRRLRLFQAARDLGADWLLTPDPDERLEQGFADRLPSLMAEGDRTVWNFTLREVFAPGLIRVDGPWGGKSKVILFPIAAAKVDPTALLHAPRVGDGAGYTRREAHLTVYHLRMATPARRQLRRDLYAAADPDRQHQALGYDYLSDERGMVLEPIPPDRSFHPPFVEDHGLWSPDPGALGAIRPDPPATRFTRAALSARRRGQAAASWVIEDLARDDPQDRDLPLLAAQFALQAGDAPRALALAQDDPGLLGRLIRARAHIALGQPAPDLAALSARLPDSPLIAALQAEAVRSTADLAAPDAVWRALAPGARISEGRVAASDLATIVIGFCSQPGLLPAVQSLLSQDEATEIVVVNSGGGTVQADLAPVADRIRLVTTDQPLRVGAARNIGLAASRAPFVAFLAGDCLAQPGWVAGRLRHHHAGAEAVATAVEGLPGAGLVARSVNLLRYAARNPLAHRRIVSNYGQSYSRRLLGLCGWFPPGLAAAEDTALNQIAARFTAPVWAPEVVTLHCDLADLAALIPDEVRRGARRAAYAPFRNLATQPDPLLAAAPILRRRLVEAGALVDHLPGLSAAERRAIRATQWLAAQGDRRGLAEGLDRIARADALLEQAMALADDPDRVLPLAEAAQALDPEDPAKARALGLARLAVGDVAAGQTALGQALALDPGDDKSAAALVALRADSDGPAAALALAERLAVAAPTTRRLWTLAADQALAVGDADWAVALGQIALAVAAATPAAHAHLARLHAAAGNTEAQSRRAETASRLSATTNRRKG